MLDLLLSVEKRGLIDDNGIKEEIGTFMFAVCINEIYRQVKMLYS
jgi:hypothetical protein